MTVHGFVSKLVTVVLDESYESYVPNSYVILLPGQI